MGHRQDGERRPDVGAARDGWVLAVVSMQEIDGSWLRIEQLFWLTSTSQPPFGATPLAANINWTAVRSRTVTARREN